MTTLQNDLIEIFNSLTEFNQNTIITNHPSPIKVSYDIESRQLVFDQKGKSVRMSMPNYYCFALEDIKKPTYLLPEDYDILMSNLQEVINSGKLLEDRVCLSPENFGFDIYFVNIREIWKGPELIGSMRFISGNSWWFRLKIKLKYGSST